MDRREILEKLLEEVRLEWSTIDQAFERMPSPGDRSPGARSLRKSCVKEINRTLERIRASIRLALPEISTSHV
jgi:hypothetical protein